MHSCLLRDSSCVLHCISGIQQFATKISVNFSNAASNNPTNALMATDFREFASDPVRVRLAWLQLLRRKGSRPRHRSLEQARRTPVPITAASNWLCFSGQLEESVRDQDWGAQPSPPPPRLATIDIPPLSLSCPLASNLPSLWSSFPFERVFLDTRNDHFNWTMDGAWRWEPIKGKNYAGRGSGTLIGLGRNY